MLSSLHHPISSSQMLHRNELYQRVPVCPPAICRQSETLSPTSIVFDGLLLHALWGGFLPLVTSVLCLFIAQDIVRRFGPLLKDPSAAEPVAYDEHFNRLLREAERGSTVAGRRASASPKVTRLTHDFRIRNSSFKLHTY